MEILKKTQAIVSSSKSYQATLLLTNNAGSAGSLSLRMDVKSAGKKGSFVQSLIGQPTGQFAMLGAAVGGSTIIDDGTSLWTYTAANRTYFKRKSVGGKATRSPFSDIESMTKNATVALGGTETVSGKPCYVINVTSKNPNAKGAQNVKVYIEKSNFHMRQIKINQTVPVSPGGPPQPVAMTIQVQNEKFNEAIPDSVFKFVPPAGAKEMDATGFGNMGLGAGGGKAPKK